MPREPIDRDPPASSLTIYLAEDEANLRSMLAIVLRRDGHRVSEFRNGGDLLSHLATTWEVGRPAPRGELMVLDLRMPEVDGLTLVRNLRQRGHVAPFLLLTAFGSREIRAEAKELGAITVLDKPFDFDEFRQVIREYARAQLAV